MIFVQLKGHDYLYQVKDIIKLFFENDIVKEKSDFEVKKGIFIYTELRKRNICFEIETVILNDGFCCYKNIHHFKPFSYLDEPEEKTIKREVKREIYIALSNFTNKKLPWGFLTGIRPVKLVHKLLSRGLSYEKIWGILQDYYFVSKEKLKFLFDVAKSEKEILDNTKPHMISIYIGIPFCKSRCLYCSFTSNSIDKYKDFVLGYIEALKTEIKGVQQIIKEKGYKIQNIYIGGGTPTAIDEKNLEVLLTEIEKTFDFESIGEYTLEAGRPDTITKEKLSLIKNFSVNRISINPQTMKDKTLKLIGRKHTSQDIINCFYMAREMGFGNINMDVIAGLPGENIKDFENTMNYIKTLNPESFTVHTMAVKRASKLTENAKFDFAPNKEASLMIDLASEYAKKMNMHPYYLYRQKKMAENLENVGYCKKGFEGIYNVQIMEEKQSIIALGAGGISKVVSPEDSSVKRAFNVKSVELYIKNVDEMIMRKKLLVKNFPYNQNARQIKP
ncbi:coproporphyrinogen dehydrogenase HemZ [Acetivibrio saccincola]|jgi:oxygen-independent coproporphyrinogen-3 oxidase|uniref:coproporphyrinogen dehydrogenase HemZ n=1 Tax=Acetivibrio saccincola TaxID=1677857 RepID=UPI002D194FD1|nr:coproporphyrinogen dehydrogenase HemZ [Acetivibrio saccincola]HQD28178.1 coproporphyrinogen dehydrogenase HemZ [Acetivibrio saccincola]